MTDVNSNRLISQLNLKLGIKTTLAALLSLYVCHEVNRFIKHPDAFLSGLWCVIASIFASLPTIGGTYKAIWNRFLGVLIGSLIGALFANFLGAHVLVLGLAIFSTVLISSLLGFQENYRIACLSAAVIIIPWGINPSISPWAYAFFRFLDTCIGMGTAAFIAQSLWPSQSLTNMRLKIADILVLIRQFYEYALVSPESLNKSENVSKSLSNEIGQAFLQNRVNLEESKIELLVGFSSISLWLDLVSGLERLWNSVRDLENVYNYTLEGVFDDELRQTVHHLTDQIDSILKDLAETIKTGSSHYNFSEIPVLQNQLMEQLIRFRATRAIKKYHLTVVESYFVFFYNIKNILTESQRLHRIIYELAKSI